MVFSIKLNVGFKGAAIRISLLDNHTADIPLLEKSAEEWSLLLNVGIYWYVLFRRMDKLGKYITRLDKFVEDFIL